MAIFAFAWCTGSDAPSSPTVGRHRARELLAAQGAITALFVLGGLYIVALLDVSRLGQRPLGRYQRRGVLGTSPSFIVPA
jgi:hypothetical protein